MLAVGSNDGVVLALTIMLPYLRVKSEQAKLTLDYLQDRMTGNQYIEAMNAEVRAGRRAGKIFAIGQPFKRSEGIGKIWNQSLAHARHVFREMATTPDGHRLLGSMRLREISLEESRPRRLCFDYFAMVRKMHARSRPASDDPSDR